MNKIKIIYLIIAITLCFELVSKAEQRDSIEIAADGSSGSTDNQSVHNKFLVSLSSPIAGYSSIDGVYYDFIPVNMEIALYKRVGLVISPSLISKKQSKDSFQLLVSLPVYFKERDKEHAYRGLFIGPVVGGAVDLPVTHGGGSVGIEAGYSWFWENGLNFKIGLMQAATIQSFRPGGGLIVELGYWFF